MQFGILGHVAPELQLKDWVTASGATAPFSLADHDGKVRVLFFFQAWCPSCHSNGFPVLKQLMDHYKGNSDVVFAAVQTVFEGFGANGPERRLDMLEDYGIDLPIAQDEGQRPETIKAYRTGGTPWFVVISPDGRVAHNDYRLGVRSGKGLIDGLVSGSATLPASQDDRILHDEARQTYLVEFAGGGTGLIDYHRNGHILNLMHSEVPASMRGKGLGGRLMERVLEDIEASGKKVRPVCSYTVAYLNRYKRWAHLRA